jgi:hypothetical protein
MRAGVDRLSRRIGELEEFEMSKITRHGDRHVAALEISLEGTLQRVFGAETLEFNRYSSAARLRPWAVSIRRVGPSPHEVQREFDEMRGTAIALLGQAVKGLEEDIAERAGAPALVPKEPQRRLRKKALNQAIRDGGVRGDEGCRGRGARCGWFFSG